MVAITTSNPTVPRLRFDHCGRDMEPPVHIEGDNYGFAVCGSRLLHPDGPSLGVGAETCPLCIQIARQEGIV